MQNNTLKKLYANKIQNNFLCLYSLLVTNIYFPLYSLYSFNAINYINYTFSKINN